MADKHTYIYILTDILQKKVVLLEQIKLLTLLLEEHIKASPLQVGLINQTLTDKSMLIKKLEELDQGFQRVYERVREELQDKKEIYINDIKILQDLIKSITDKSVQLNELEQRINKLFMGNVLKEKQDIRNYKQNKKTTSNYNRYNNLNIGESYFFDKKK